jgi:trehalose 6-phosphate synthase/phosphatase
MRLIIVSNRLPVTLSRKGGKHVISESSGGLVTGLSSYLDSMKGSGFESNVDYVWVGWPGSDVPDAEKPAIEAELLEKYRAVPVFLSPDLMENFYQGFCNSTIWPLFHYFPSFAVYQNEYWEYYNNVNRKFLDVLLPLTGPDDLVWIHDYHLMLLPGMLREKLPGIKMGFFLHIPFPTYEIFSMLPSSWRAGILEGLLGSDLIGFHTYNDTQYFIRCVLRILGRESDMANIPVDTRYVKVDTFPMGIDFNKFMKVSISPEAEKEREELKKIFYSGKVILSIDRLDYTKGILNRLQAYEIFLDKYSGWREKVILVLMVIPSRIGVKSYRKLKKQIDEEVGRINGKFGTLKWTPISYQYDHIPFQPLVALYSIADVMLVTPLRDGMNLIAKEYIASRNDKSGVLILSEMAGASKEMGEALIVNPNDRDDIAEMIRYAIEMPAEEQEKRIDALQTRLRRYDVVKWADDFINKILSVIVKRQSLSIKLLSGSLEEQLLNDFRKSERGIIFMDYDGTLVPYKGTPGEAEPGSELSGVLKKLGDIEKCEVVLMSGRDKDTLERWFGGMNLSLVAEHGSWMKEKGNEWQLVKTIHQGWKPKIKLILETYVDRLPGSFVEDKDSSLVWHYRRADPELAIIRKRELMDHLYSFTANIDVTVIKGNKVIEIRNSGIDKGSTALNWILKNRYDFLMAAGDDATDEDMFRVLPEWAYTIKIGTTAATSRCFLPDYHALVTLLTKMT